MNTKKIPKSIGVFAIYFFSSLITLIPLITYRIITNIFKIHINFGISESMQDILLQGFTYIVLLIIFFFIYRKDLKEDFIKFKSHFSMKMDTAVKYWLIGLAIMMISNIIIGLCFKNASADNENAVQEIIKNGGAITIILFGVLGPIIEEIAFRKTFRDVIKNDLAFVLIAGIFFGGAHVIPSIIINIGDAFETCKNAACITPVLINSAYNLLYLIPYCALGIAFTKVYQKTDSIFYSILIHIMHNTILVTLSVIGAYLGVVLW